jgi:LDH2 family malate/lactate/ureidoglycolate dehydrogenase
MLATIKNADPVDPATPIRFPGERSLAERERRRPGIPLADATFRALDDWAKRLDAPTPALVEPRH